MSTFFPFGSRRGPVLAAAVGVLVAFAVLVLAIAGRPGTAPASAAETKPTIVLVHGAWADGSSWGDVVTRLQQRGYTVDVPPNPLRGLQSDAAYIRAFLDTLSGPIVLVGHSYGGAVITNAAKNDAQVKALAYIDAFAPAENETVIQLSTERPGSALGGNPADVFDAVPYPGGQGDVDLYIKRTVFPDAVANDLPPKEAALLGATQRPVALSALLAPSGPPAWEDIESWYFVGTADHAVPPAEQRFMAARANAHTVEVKASHLSMVSRPQQVTDLILDAAQSVG